jgi:hypothetical protein
MLCWVFASVAVLCFCSVVPTCVPFGSLWESGSYLRLLPASRTFSSLLLFPFNTLLTLRLVGEGVSTRTTYGVHRNDFWIVRFRA